MFQAFYLKTKTLEGKKVPVFIPLKNCWTLVRVPLIEFTDTKGETIVSLEDCSANKISANDIATFIVEQLSDETYVKKSPFIANA